MDLQWCFFASLHRVWVIHGEVFKEGRVFSRGVGGTMMCFHLTPEHVHLLTLLLLTLAALLFETAMLFPRQTLFIHLTPMVLFLELPFLSDIILISFLVFPVLPKEFLGESLLSPFIPFVRPGLVRERSLVYDVCTCFKYKGKSDGCEKQESGPDTGIHTPTATGSIE